MAKNKTNFNFAAFLTELKEQTVQAPEIEVKSERKYFLIVSEGIRTEPIYFQYLAEQLPKKLIDTVDVHGAGVETINVVTAAINLRDKRDKSKTLPKYDEVWAVYDKDDFPDARYQAAIDLAAVNGIESGHSNQSFELWYVLHFQFLQNALHRNAYINILSGQLGFKYAKNSRKVAEFLFDKPRIRQAIAWAKALEVMHEGIPEAQSCPYTRVYVLVERLLDYMEGINQTGEAIGDPQMPIEV